MQKNTKLFWRFRATIFLSIILMTCFGLNILSAPAAHAAIPTTLGYQGRLKNSSGTALTGTFSFTFRIYASSTGGVPLYTEVHPAVSVDTGFFSVQLGSITPFPASLDFNQPLFLTSEVQADGEMTPRVTINSVSYAFTSGGINALPAAPVSATGGRMYYNMADGSLNYYDATQSAWQQIGVATGTLQSVTNAGNSTTNAIQFNGGTSTGAFTVSGNTTLSNAVFVDATGTNLELLGALTAPQATITDLTSTNGTITNILYANGTSTSWLGFATASGTTLNASSISVNGSSVCLADGSNCPSGTAANLQTVTNAGNTTTNAIQFNGGTSTGAFTVSGNTTLSNAVFVDATGTNLELLGALIAPQATITDLTSTNSTSTNLFATNATITNLSVLGVTPSNFTNLNWTNATGTNTTSTNLFADVFTALSGKITDLTVTGTTSLQDTTFTNGTSTSWLGFATASGTTLNVSSIAVNGSSVCLLDGTNCPSGTAANLQTVTNAGNTTTNAIQFNGGTSTADFNPSTDATLSLGSATNRWNGQFATVTSTEFDAGATSLVDGTLQKTAGTLTIHTVGSGNIVIDPVSAGGPGSISLGVGAGIDVLNVNADIGTDLIPSTANAFDLGSASEPWRETYSGGLDFTNATGSSVTTTNIYATNAMFANFTTVNSAPTNITWTNATGTNTTSTNLFATNGVFSNLFVTDGVGAGITWTNATGTNTTSTNLTVLGGLSLPNDSVTDPMVSDTLTVGPLGNVSATSINSGVLGNSNVTLDLSAFGSVTGTLPANRVSILTANISGGLTSQDAVSALGSVGVIFGGTLAQSASGTISISAGRGFFGSAPSAFSTKYASDWATESSIAIAPDNVWYYVYKFFNGVAPVTVVTTTDLTNDSRYAIFAQVLNPGDGEMHIHDLRLQVNGATKNITSYLDNNFGNIISAGCVLSDPGSRTVAVSACTNWYGLSRHDIPAFNSSVTGTFDQYYRDGSGGFVQTDQTQWDNQNYDDGSGTLASLGAGDFGIHWVYQHETGDEVNVVYGRADYATLADALAAQAPTEASLPSETDNNHGILVGAIVFQQGASVPAEILDLRPRFGTSGGSGSSIPQHNELSGLQGGALNDYYHVRHDGYDFAGGLEWSANGGNLFDLRNNATTDTKITVSNLGGGTASLDIATGDLQLASTTRINNAGFGFLSGLDLGGGGITNAGSLSGVSDLTVTGTTSLAGLTFTDATGTSVTSTNLYATNAVFGNVTITNPTLLSNITWTDATGTNTTSTNLFATNGVFSNLFVTDGAGAGITWVNATGTNTTSTNLFATNGTILTGNLTDLTVTGTTSIQALSFTNGTSSNWLGFSTASGTTLHTLTSNSENLTATNATLASSTIAVASLGGTTFAQTDINNDVAAPGWVSGGDITITGYNTFDVSAGVGYIRANNSHTSKIYRITWPASTGNMIASGTLRYVYVSYNAGNPQVIVGASPPADEEQNITLANVLNIFQVTSYEDRHRVADFQGLVHTWAKALMGFRVASGDIMTATTTRFIEVSAGDVFDANFREFATPYFDTAVGSYPADTADTFAAVYRDGLGGYNLIPFQTEWDNTKIDSPAGTLTTMTDGDYANQWVFRTQSGDKIVEYGQAEYPTIDLAAAEKAPVPPAAFNNVGYFITQITFQKNGTQPALITDIRPTIGGSTSAGGGGGNLHNNLSGLQGGQPGEEYHLTAAEHAFLTNTSTPSAGAVIFSDNIGLQYDSADFNWDNVGKTLNINGGLTFVNGTGTSVTSTNLFTTNGTISNLSFANGTSTSWLGFTTASGTTLNASSISANSFVTTNATISGGTINNMSIGATTPSTGVFTNSTSTNIAVTTNASIGSTLSVTGLSTLTGGYVSQASSTVVGNFTDTGLSSLQTLTFTSGTSSNWLGFATASGTSLFASSIAVNGSSVCLANGSNCPGAAATTATLQTITNNGASTTNLIYAFGGINTLNLTATGTLNVTGLSTLAGGYVSQASSTVVGAFTDTGLSTLGGGFVSQGSSTVVGNFTGTGSTALQALTFTTGTSTSVTTTNLAVLTGLSLPNNSITDGEVVNGLTIDSSGNINATALNSGTLGNGGVTLALGSFGAITGSLTDSNVADALTINGGTINNTPIGATTPSTGVFTNSTSTNIFATNFTGLSNSLTNLTVTGTTSLQTLTFTSGTSSNWLGFATASGTSLFASSIAVNGSSVCLANGSNCPGAAATTATLQTITNNGASTTNLIYAFGGINTLNLSATGTLSAAGLSTLTSGFVSQASSTIVGNGTVTGLLTVGGGYVSQASSTIVGAATITGNGTIGGTLGVTGLSTLTGGYVSQASSTIVGNFTDTGLSTLTGGFVSQSSSTIVGAGTITGATALGSTLSVTGLSTLTGGYVSQASSTVVGNFTDTGLSSLQTLTFTSGTSSNWLGFATASGTTINTTVLSVNGSSVCLSNGTNCPSSVSGSLQTVTNSGASTTNLIYAFGGINTLNLTATGTLNVTGLSTLAGGFVSQASSTIVGNGTVTGLLTVGGGYVSQASSTIVGAATITGNGTIGGTLGVTGLSTLTGGYVSQASSTIVGNFTDTGLSTLTGGFVSQASSTVVGNFTDTGLSSLQTLTFTNGTSSNWLGFATASGTTINATSIKVNGSAVCTADGTNCPTIAPNVKTASSTTIFTLTATEQSVISVTVTPSNTTNQMWIVATAQVKAESNTDRNVVYKIRRGSSCSGTQVGVTVTSTLVTTAEAEIFTVSFVDSPATTAATSYQLCLFNDASAASTVQGSSMTVEEVKPGADLAEVYYSSDNTIGPGTVVSLDPKTAGWIVPSNGANDPHLLGVVSTRPNMVMSESGQGTPNMVALSGRVPVTVSTQNGAIQPGDYLTSSDIPGVAMKATAAGLTLGRALSNFGDASSSEVTTGQVMMFVQNGYYMGDANAASLTQSGIASIQPTGQSPEVALPAGAETKDALGVGTLVVTDATFSGNVTVKDHLYLGGDSVGEAKIVSGMDHVQVTFSQSYLTQPVVTISPMDFVDTMYRVTDVTTAGFTIQLNGKETNDKLFSWHAFGSDGAKVTVSDGTSQDITVQTSSDPTLQPTATVVSTTSTTDTTSSGTTSTTDTTTTTSPDVTSSSTTATTTDTTTTTTTTTDSSTSSTDTSTTPSTDTTSSGTTSATGTTTVDASATPTDSSTTTATP